ncbi:hypothetical protein HG535_0D04410 [Zygotorulaspora mrakii]|uniref:Uncharacterized protein n=1 Tax=Zygotorulaspora mrakii TaxID=42260 RepID=A0A7H9B2M0_ZYGMR|nr:uncharacterized protein HG535_0D04410 [Zygotorulaspora mrakii]QLG72733.1 hypothetical protein HG535_0D04410 [Zygotorulaspora mrakii]
MSIMGHFLVIEQAHNSHLQDYVDVGGFGYSGENVLTAIVAGLMKYQIVQKAATITANNAANDTCAHFYLTNMKVLKVEVHRFLNGCHLIRCRNHVLNNLFKTTDKPLKIYKNIGRVLINLTKLAKLLTKLPFYERHSSKRVATDTRHNRGTMVVHLEAV